ncbi:MAG: DUF5597 domain-containing protein [Bacteroidales bacterium]|nr:DUF5597 domain-containing protein [Bacteroidales bacterium]
MKTLNIFRKQILITLASLLLFCINSAYCQNNTKIPYLQKTGISKQLILDGKPFIMLAGELHNSSSSNLAYMDSIWSRMVSFHLNTLLAPVTWEMIEPEEGKFDFTNVDSLIIKAREYNLHLVFLWFGTWKNACSTYPPLWVRQNTKRFKRAQSVKGENLNAISCFSTETNKADAKAFASLMRHIKEFDGNIHTVLTIQVENESGLRYMSRDHSPLADEAFKNPVPNQLIDFLKKNRNTLIPEFDAIWRSNGYKTIGNWTEIFGNDADEVFMAWYTGQYIEKVAEAGKAEYPLPMYANAWLDGGKAKAGDYPSGGPVAKMIPVWQAAAPHIDMLAPDIYRPDFAFVCDTFTRMGNPLFIPETSFGSIAAENIFYAIGKGAICFSPFAIDNINRVPLTTPIADSYLLLSHLIPYLQKYQYTDKLIGFLGKKGETLTCDLGNYSLSINFTGNSFNIDTISCGLLIATSDDEFIAAGSGYTVTFLTKSVSKPHAEIDYAYELIYKNGQWIRERRLNGDETGVGSIHNIALRMEEKKLTVKTAKIFSYE